MAAKTRNKAKREYRRHGVTPVKRAVYARGIEALDGRLKAVRDLREWIEELTADLGGPEAVSVQQRTLIELAARDKAVLDHLDAWLLEQRREPIDKKRKRLWPIVRERTAISESLARKLQALGLERRKPPAQELTAYVQEKYGGDGDDDGE